MSIMAQFRVDIFRTEFYSRGVIVEAASEEDARKKISQQWDDSDDLYELVNDYMTDSNTEFDITEATARDLETCVRV